MIEIRDSWMHQWETCFKKKLISMWIKELIWMSVDEIMQIQNFILISYNQMMLYTKNI